MRYKLEDLYIDIKKRLPLEEYRKIRIDIYNSEKDIIEFLKDGFGMCLSKSAKDVLNNELTRKVIEGMDNINRYCKVFGHELIFQYDENDLVSILKCLTAFEASLADFTI